MVKTTTHTQSNEVQTTPGRVQLKKPAIADQASDQALPEMRLPKVVLEGQNITSALMIKNQSQLAEADPLLASAGETPVQSAPVTSAYELYLSETYALGLEGTILPPTVPLWIEELGGGVMMDPVAGAVPSGADMASLENMLANIETAAGEIAIVASRGFGFNSETSGVTLSKLERNGLGVTPLDFEASGRDDKRADGYDLGRFGFNDDVGAVRIVPTPAPVAPAPVDPFGARADVAATTNMVLTTSGNVLANDIATGDKRLTSVMFNGTRYDIQPGAEQIIDGAYGQLVIRSDGSYTFNAFDQMAGQETITYTMEEVATGRASSAVLTLSANDLVPVIVNDQVTTTNMVYTSVGNLLSNDATGNQGTIRVFGGQPVPAGGLTIDNPGFTVTVYPDGRYSFTAKQGQVGNYTMDYQVTDADGDSTVGEVQFNYRDALPFAGNDIIETTNTLMTRTGNIITANDGGGDGSLVVRTVNGQSVPAGGLVMDNADYRLTIHPDGRYEFVAKDGRTGTVKLTYDIVDADGDVASAQISLAFADQLPVARDDTADADPMNMVRTGNLLTNDTDGDGMRTLATFDGRAIPADGLTITTGDYTLVVQPDGSYTLTAVDGRSGNASFAYEITDRDGDRASAFLRISYGDSLPTAVDDTITTNNMTMTRTGDLLANDTGGNGTKTIVSVDGRNVPVDGLRIENDNYILVVRQNGTYDFTAKDGRTGAVNLDYQVRDADGDVSAAKIAINYADKMPTAYGGTGTVLPSDPQDITGNLFADYRANNQVVGGDGTVRVHSMNGQVIPAGGYIDLDFPGLYAIRVYANGDYTAHVVNGGKGEIRLEFNLIDEDGDISNMAILTSVFNDTLVVGADEARDMVGVATNGIVNFDTTVSAAQGVLANETVRGDGGLTVFAGDYPGTHGGRLVLNADGSYTYSNNNTVEYFRDLIANGQAYEEFTYRLEDADGDFSTATLRIDLRSDGITWHAGQPGAQAPTLNVVDVVGVNEDTEFKLAIEARLTDTTERLVVRVEVLDPSWTLVAGKDAGFVRVGNTNVYERVMSPGQNLLDGPTFMPPANYSGTASVFKVSAMSEETMPGGQRSAPVSDDDVKVTVLPVSDTPTDSSTAMTLSIGGAAQHINYTASVTDPSERLTIKVAIPAGVTVLDDRGFTLVNGLYQKTFGVGENVTSAMMPMVKSDVLGSGQITVTATSQDGAAAASNEISEAINVSVVQRVVDGVTVDISGKIVGGGSFTEDTSGYLQATVTKLDPNEMIRVEITLSNGWGTMSRPGNFHNGFTFTVLPNGDYFLTKEFPASSYPNGLTGYDFPEFSPPTNASGNLSGISMKFFTRHDTGESWVQSGGAVEPVVHITPVADDINYSVSQDQRSFTLSYADPGETNGYVRINLQTDSVRLSAGTKEPGTNIWRVEAKDFADLKLYTNNGGWLSWTHKISIIERGSTDGTSTKIFNSSVQEFFLKYSQDPNDDQTILDRGENLTFAVPLNGEKPVLQPKGNLLDNVIELGDGSRAQHTVDLMLGAAKLINVPGVGEIEGWVFDRTTNGNWGNNDHKIYIAKNGDYWVEMAPGRVGATDSTVNLEYRVVDIDGDRSDFVTMRVVFDEPSNPLAASFDQLPTTHDSLVAGVLMDQSSPSVTSNKSEVGHAITGIADEPDVGPSAKVIPEPALPPMIDEPYGDFPIEIASMPGSRESLPAETPPVERGVLPPIVGDMPGVTHDPIEIDQMIQATLVEQLSAINTEDLDMAIHEFLVKSAPREPLPAEAGDRDLSGGGIVSSLPGDLTLDSEPI